MSLAVRGDVSGDRDLGRVPFLPAGDGDLRACGEELGLSPNLESDLLDADQILRTPISA